MSDLLNDLDDNKYAYVSYLEAMYQAIRGYSVKSGMNITPNTGLQLTVSSGIVSDKGIDISYIGETITIDASETDKDRIDVIVYDFLDDTVKILKGSRWVTDGEVTNAPLTTRCSTTQLPLAIITVYQNTTEILTTEIEEILFDNFYNSLGTLLPYITDTEDLGSPTKKWNNIYASNYYQTTSKTTGVIGTAYDEKIYFFIPDYVTTVEIRVFGRKPSATVQTHSHGTHTHTESYSEYNLGTVQTRNTGETEVGSGVVTASPVFPNGVTLRVNGTGAHGPYGNGTADADSGWIDITSEITTDSSNYLELLATTAGCVSDIEIRYK